MSLKRGVAIVAGGNGGIGMAISVGPAEAEPSIFDRLPDNPMSHPAVAHGARGGGVNEVDLSSAPGCDPDPLP